MSLNLRSLQDLKVLRLYGLARRKSWSDLRNRSLLVMLITPFKRRRSVSRLSLGRRYLSIVSSVLLNITINKIKPRENKTGGKILGLGSWTMYVCTYRCTNNFSYIISFPSKRYTNRLQNLILLETFTQSFINLWPSEKCTEHSYIKFEQHVYLSSVTL